MRGIIVVVVVVVGQKPLIIHVAPDSDEHSVAKTSSRCEFRLTGNPRTVSRTFTPPRSRCTPSKAASSRNEEVPHRAKRDAMSQVFVIREERRDAYGHSRDVCVFIGEVRSRISFSSREGIFKPRAARASNTEEGFETQIVSPKGRNKTRHSPALEGFSYIFFRD